MKPRHASARARSVNTLLGRIASVRSENVTVRHCCADAGLPELHRLARTISAWQDQLLAYFHTGRSSTDPTEAVNLLIERFKRVGFGFRNFENYRLRLLLYCGATWHTHRAARIRGRSPRLVS